MLLLQTGCEMEGFLTSITTDGTLLNSQGITLFYNNILKFRTLLFGLIVNPLGMFYTQVVNACDLL